MNKKTELGIKEILDILPHRYPFLLIDKVSVEEGSQKAVGIKNVTINEPFFQGHFPDNPIMPGVLIIEAMAQVGGILARLSMPEVMDGDNWGSIFFISMDKVKFRKPVIPGDQIVFKITPLRKGSRIWKIAGKAFVGDDLVAEAELLATIG